MRPFIDCICNPFSPPTGDTSTCRWASDKKRNQTPAKGKASVLSTSPKKPPAAASEFIEIMSSDVESNLPVTPIKNTGLTSKKKVVAKMYVSVL